MRDAEQMPFVARLLRRSKRGAPAPVQTPATPTIGTSGPPAIPASAPRSAPPTRVLLVARDRRFRAVASTLLSQRGNIVLDCRSDDDVAEVAVRERVDVVLLDASASLTAAAREAGRLASLHPPVAVVAVGEETHPGLAALPVWPKWTSFDDVFAAVERARADSSDHGITSGAR